MKTLNRHSEAATIDRDHASKEAVFQSDRSKSSSGFVWSLLSFIGSQSAGYFLRKTNRRLIQGFRLLANMRSHLRAVKVFNLPNIKPFVIKNPRIPYKYFTDYISPCFSLDDRRKILQGHYLYINSFFPQKLLLNIPDSAVVWRNCGPENIRIDLAIAERYWIEGELELKYHYCDQLVYTMTFTIIQGEIIGIADQPYVLLIGGLQGAPRCADQIRKAGKLNDIFPSTHLLVVLQAIGQFLGMTTIAGISSNVQYSGAKKKTPINLSGKYDCFWMEHGGWLHSKRFYCLATKLRAYAPRGKNHSSRKKNRLRYKTQLVEDVMATMVSGM